MRRRPRRSGILVLLGGRAAAAFGLVVVITPVMPATASGSLDESSFLAVAPGIADPTTSTIDADPATSVADGTSSSTLTIQLIDDQGEPLTTGGDVVTTATDLGQLSDVVDNTDGTYTAVLTSATTAGPALVTFTVNGIDATYQPAVPERHGGEDRVPVA